jgi:putative membrane protein
MAEAQRHKIKAEGTYGTPPLQPSRQAQMTKEQLEKLSSAEFDKAFIQRLIRDHEMDIAQFQEEAKNGKDTATRDLADSALPTLQEHLRQAREIGARAGQS